MGTFFQNVFSGDGGGELTNTVFFNVARILLRLALFPEPERADLILWWLWSRDRSDEPTGVYSHLTALSPHELTDANPSRLDITVPPSFRRGVPVPKVLRLHHGQVSEAERENLFGVPVTNALRTVLDVWQDGSLPKTTLREAFQQGRSTGTITRKQEADLLRDARFASVARQLRAS